MPHPGPRRIDDTSLFGGFFQEYRLQLRRFLRGRLRSAEDLDDITQEVFARFLRVNLKELRKPRAYLFGIAAHVICEFRMRLRQEQDWMTIDSEIVESAMERPDAARSDELAEQVCQQREILAALARLPRMQRTVLLMVKHDGLSYEEVAQATHLSINTVERYVVEARAKLKAVLWDR